MATLRRGLVWLMAARLGLSLVSFGLALALESGDTSTAEWRGFYGTIAFAFLATVAYGFVERWGDFGRRFAFLNVGIDIAIVTALVHFSGGPDSAFAFLYALVVIYAALLFDARGALVSGIGSVGAYAAVLVAHQRGWITPGELELASAAPGVFTLWFAHASAVALVATLSSVLAAELRRTGEALDQRTSDLEQLRSLHQRTVESLMSGLLTTDLRGRITSFNPEAARITGLAGSEAIGRPVEEILPDVLPLLAACDEERGAERARHRIPFRGPEGGEHFLGVAAYILRDGDGSRSGYVIIFQDVTRVVEMERELYRSERMAAVGQLSASIAHEIRNPLASISGSIELLRVRVRGGDGQDDPRPLMDIVLRETERLNRLITDFLCYARPGPRHLEEVPLREAVEEVVGMFESVRAENVRIAVDVPAQLAAWADAAQLRQLLWNLVLNAAEAMPDGGTLAISAAARGDPLPQEPAGGDRKGSEEMVKSGFLEVVVSDEGVGVPPESRERIFDPFFTTKRLGSGLGLATVHRIVEDHGGSVRLESRVGAGTAVRLRLPQAEGA